MSDSLNGLGYVDLWRLRVNRVHKPSMSVAYSRWLTEYTGTKLRLDEVSQYRPNKFSFTIMNKTKAEEYVFLEKFAALQGRYEVQVLDSYGLKGEDNECGGIYRVKAPRVNMCAPPGQWQTYDITFRAATAESKPTLTVRHNGVLIQEGTEVGRTTTAGMGGRASQPGGLYLQDHHNKVEYRNIWLVEQ